MPELPEVETARRTAHAAVTGRRIVRVNVTDDPIVFEAVSPATIKRTLTGATITGSGRKGKHWWLELNRRPWLLLHFGMTGWTDVYRAGDERPRFWKLELILNDGTHLAYRDPRRLGRIRLRDDPATEPPVSLLGFDPMLEWPGSKVFSAGILSRKAPIKAVLLDQSFCAGIGNWIADETLYQSRVAPARPACSLTAAEIKRLQATLRTILDHAISVGSDDRKFPPTWLFHYRWGKTKSACDGHGRPIAFCTVGGRTSAWVPGYQR